MTQTDLGGGALFGTDSTTGSGGQGKTFGNVYRGRYHMPLLPDEAGTKSGGDWVPYGVMRASNLAGAISESRALGIWERERTQIGLAFRPDLYERMVIATRRLLLTGFDFANQKLRDYPEGLELQAELELIHEEARQAAGANAAAQHGTNHHDVWETFSSTGSWAGTPKINENLQALERLLADAGLERVPALCERVIRNVRFNAAGRFDNVLRVVRPISFEVKLPDGSVAEVVTVMPGTLLMADLKTKRTPFWSFLEARIQMAIYASARWMLDVEIPPQEYEGRVHAVTRYVDGPLMHVNQEWGVLLRVPVDGAPPYLQRVNLTKGLELAELARRVVDARAEAKNQAAHQEAAWS